MWHNKAKGGAMARKYGHIQNFEKEIKEMLGEGLTHRKIGERLSPLLCFTNKNHTPENASSRV